jgi:hypothetical protein
MSRLYYGWHWKHMSESAPEEHRSGSLCSSTMRYRRRHVCNTDMRSIQIWNVVSILEASIRVKVCLRQSCSGIQLRSKAEVVGSRPKLVAKSRLVSLPVRRRHSTHPTAHRPPASAVTDTTNFASSSSIARHVLAIPMKYALMSYALHTHHVGYQ